MSDLNYHLETENKNCKCYLILNLVSASKKTLTKNNVCSFAATSSEKSALEFLIKELSRTDNKGNFSHIQVSPERAFHALKLIGATGRVFYKGKKVVIDPFTSYDFYFEANRQDSETALVKGFWKLGNQAGALQECEWIMPADPSWILKDGIIRSIKEGISSQWVRLAISGPGLLKGQELSHFLSRTQDEIQVNWISGEASQIVEPLPFLTLSCRHGGFADLWFDYGAYGRIAAHDSTSLSWRNVEAERSWETDLLETDFIKKLVEHSHYYCPLNKVAKSLTFLLEMGWAILDAHGRKVLRQKKAEFDAQFSEDKIVICAKIYYDDHQVDLKDLVGAFNRQEHFVELSPHVVALLDRENFSKEWGDFAEQEMTSEGIRVNKNRIGLLEQLLEQPNLIIREDLKQKIAKMSRCEPSSPIDPSEHFQGTLFSYQKEGLQWLKFLEEGSFGGLLADEMGLGKTVQVLAFFSLLSFQRPCLVVVPTSLLFNWKREIKKFLPSLIVYSHQGKDRLQNREELEQKQIILTSYALLRLDADILQEIDYQAVVLDEGQMIKNPDSQIATCCFRLQSQIRLVITGTPIENRLEDLWSIFHFLQPDLLGERRQFQAEALLLQMGTQYLDRIRKKIKPFLLRRKKEQVALQLPPKFEQTVFVEMTESQRDIYERWLRNTKQGLLKKVSLDGAGSHRMEILEAILRLRQLCAHPWLVEERRGEEAETMSAKYDRILADSAEVIEEKRKVLIYSQFTQMLRLLEAGIQQKGWSYVYLDGSTINREEVVCRFQEDPQVSIFLISLKAGGVGLNLTAADYVFLYDPWWNEAVERQAIDRAHRLGKKETVVARRYITALSIEEKMMRLKAHKTMLSEQLLESEEGFGQISLEDLLGLLT
jgi:superfamily II DNA or RNA helicase